MVLIVTSYIGISALTSSSGWVSILLYTFISLGGGAGFMSGLSTSIKISPTGSGYGVGLVSAAMSLSLAASVKIIQIYQDNNNCGTFCWQYYVLILSIFVSGCFLVGGFALLLFNPSNYSHLGQQTEEINETEIDFESKNKKSALRIFKHPYFYILFTVYFAAIGSSTLILTVASEVWGEVNNVKEWEGWIGNIMISFSFLNAGFNFIIGLGLDIIERRKIIDSPKILIFTLLLMTVNFGGMGLIQVLRATRASIVFFAGMMAFSGVGFGVYLVIIPVLTSRYYGAKDFGKNYSFLQIGGGVSSFITPILANVCHEYLGVFYPIFFIYSFLLLASFLLMIFVKRTAFD